MKKAFTLLEINLAIGIMAGAVLTVVTLFTYGARENRQSREDVVSAAYADAVLSPLVTAISATNLKWSVFQTIESYPDQGWGSYVDSSTGSVLASPESRARSTYSYLMGKLKNACEGTFPLSSTTFPDAAAGGLRAGLVIRKDDYHPAVIQLGFRATANVSQLIAAPLYFTEARFQGIADK